MFTNLWPSSPTSSTPSAPAVRQANEQLAAMAGRQRELETRVREQAELLHRRDAEHASRFAEARHAADGDRVQMGERLRGAEQRLAKAEAALKERDVTIAFLLHRCSFIDEAASYAPLLEHLSATLKTAGMASAPPMPKVQPVKPTHVAETDTQQTYVGHEQQQQAAGHRGAAQAHQAFTHKTHETATAAIVPHNETAASRGGGTMQRERPAPPPSTSGTKSVFVTTSVAPGTYVPLAHFQQRQQQQHHQQLHAAYRAQ